jgi:MFS family permease
MLISFLFAPIAMLALGFSRGLSSIMALTCLLGFFTDLYRPAVSAAITDIVQPAARPRAFGYLYWAINLGAALAPILAGLMARYDYLLLFIGDAVTTFAFAVIILLRVPETQPMEVVPAARISVFARVGNLKREPILLVFTLLALFFGMIYTQGHVTLPLDMQRRGLSPADYGLATAVNGALIVLVTLKLSRAAERWPRFTSMAISALLVGAGFGLTGLSRTLPAYAFTVIVWTFGEIIAASVAPTIIGDLAPVELRGLYQGIFGSAWGLSFFVGPVLGGLVYERFGPGSLWFACFALGVAVCLGYLTLARPANHRLARAPAAAAGLAPSP